MYEEEQTENEKTLEKVTKIRDLCEEGFEKVKDIAKASTMEEKLELVKEYNIIIKSIKKLGKS